VRLRLLVPRGGRRAELRRHGLSAGRDLELEGCVNARDLGGLPTIDGRQTRRRALVRADAVDGLTPAGWTALHDHGVRTIVDLRNGDERAGAAEPEGIDAVHIELDSLDEDEDFWADWMNGPQFATPLYYAPFLERFPHRMEQVLDAIEHARPGGVLFHCFGGRDRTGLVAIVLLAIAGVTPDAIADDYARAAERAPTHDPALDDFLAARGTSARELVTELVGTLAFDRPGLRARLVVE
jgi:protein tyrosine/serine phosphatase